MPEGSLDDHERRVAEDRAALAESLDRLGDTLAPERLKAEAASVAREYGSEIQRQLWGAARENPAAFALVGAGLALLLSGGGRRPEDEVVTPRHDQEGSAVPPGRAVPPVRPDAPAMRAADRHDSRWRPSARHLRSALGRGLDRLPPKARARVREARLAAIRAQEDFEFRASRLAARADRAVHERPVTAAATAFGIGALVAAFLPATRREDEAMGARRDRLMDEAQAVLERELDALQAHMTRSGKEEQRPEGSFEVPS